MLSSLTLAVVSEASVRFSAGADELSTGFLLVSGAWVDSEVLRLIA